MKKLLSFLIAAIILIGIISLASCQLVIVLPTTTTTTTNEDIQTNDPPTDHVHTEEVIPAVESTCAETGLSEGRKCSECGEILVEQKETPLKAHTEETIEAVKATCTETGLSEGKKCSECDAILAPQQETPIIAHSYDDKYDENCNNCGFVRDAECAHKETEVIEGYEATCTSTGLTDGEKCKKCGEINVSQTVISIKDHTEVIDEAVAPTCTETGLTEGSHCGVCGAIITTQASINAKGHTFGDWVTVKEATTTEEGLNERYCECGEKETELTLPTASKGLVFESNGDGSYTVIDYVESDNTELFIPNTYKGFPVTHIKYSAFANCDSLTSVVISNSITSIGSDAFNGCDNLVNVTIENPNIGNIEQDAFYNCNSLKYNEYDNAYYLGNENNPYLVLVKAKNYEISSCNIHADTKSIAGGAFISCTKLQKIIIPNSVTHIGGGAFFYCISLSGLTLGNSVTSIGSQSFGECILLRSVTLPDSLLNIEYSSFGDCTSLKYNEYNNAYYLGTATNPYFVLIKPKDENLTSCELHDDTKIIGNNAFTGCYDLENIVMSKFLIYIGKEAFWGCTSLRDVVIPDSVSTIGDKAFLECDSIWDMIIPSSVINMGYDAFGGCYYIRLFCEAESKPIGWNDEWEDSLNQVQWGYTGE